MTKKRNKGTGDKFLVMASALEAKQNRLPEKIVNLNTLCPNICKATRVLEVASGLIAEIVDIDEYKGIGVVAINRGERSTKDIMYDSQEFFEERLNKGRLKLLSFTNVNI